MSVDLATLQNRFPQEGTARIGPTAIQEMIDKNKKAIESTDFKFTPDQLDALTLEMASYDLATSLAIEPSPYLDKFKLLDKQYRAAKSSAPAEARYKSVTACKLPIPKGFR